MKVRMLRGASCAVLALLVIAGQARAETFKITSPDKRIDLIVDSGENGASYSVLVDGKAVLAPSPFGINMRQVSLGGGKLTVLDRKERSVDQRIDLVVGKAKSIPDRYNESEISFRQGGDKPYVFTLIARAYDDGVALRYAVQEQPGLDRIEIVSERTRFDFPADYHCWGINQGRYKNPHEGEFDPLRVSDIRPFHLFDAPLVCKTGEGQTTFAIAEADKRDYAGAYLSGRQDGKLGVEVNLSPRRDIDPDQAFNNTAVKRDLAAGPLLTPWRVVMIGHRPGDLAASTLITALGAPSVVRDTSWIKPGKAAWDWWNGWAVNIPDAGVNTATYKAYIDQAAAMKLEYMLIDEGWYEGSDEAPLPADVTRPIAAVDMPAILRYASDRGVGIWLWLQWKQLDRQLDEALALYEKWGVKGIKVDFMDRNDQDMVDFYHKILTKTAEHRLMVDLHGAYPPDGLVRTYPHYMTQEGVMGAEYNKWSGRVTARHNVTLPFTRMILGPIDYTPGGFRHLSPDAFAQQRRFNAPYVQTTRGQALAMYVVYDSPLQMVSDSPDAYRNAEGGWADGADFIMEVPASWDETRVLQGDIGEYIVTARRKGKTWYLGAMTNEDGREISVPLDFLGKGKFQARIWEDGANISAVRTTRRDAAGGGTLSLKLAPSGGAVAVFSPAR